ncbi:hypothetical protein Hypma_002130 [Hypsizygus marmoreus]|uniref:Uncharacterized protein n=1 Tax=Hypsizygus marmoreus TaxID=39966 RepID=A0A369K7P0_HYPMA|nr:hypothetical protein Hypma_002130 [Hypsizygus marmoreus]
MLTANNFNDYLHRQCLSPRNAPTSVRNHVSLIIRSPYLNDMYWIGSCFCSSFPSTLFIRVLWFYDLEKYMHFRAHRHQLFIRWKPNHGHQICLSPVITVVLLKNNLDTLHLALPFTSLVAYGKHDGMVFLAIMRSISGR